MSTLTFISLFAGIGGIDLGLERAGMRCVAQVEIDDYCNQVLSKHWPNVPRFKDVREVGAHNLPSADVIAGGFPCQDISDAGRRAGITGERSGLWSEYARIIRELRPHYVLVENVAALLHRGLDVVLGSLAPLGYDAEWHCIPAAAVGAPHRRDRLFIVAYATGGRMESERIPTKGRALMANTDGRGLAVAYADSAERRALAQGRHVFDGYDTGRQEAASRLSAFRADAGSRQWSTEPNVGRMAHGIPARVDRLKGLGNAVVPQVAEFVGRAIVAHSEVLA